MPTVSWIRKFFFHHTCHFYHPSKEEFEKSDLPPIDFDIEF
jgi:hypothetical protein